jgi:hypothetical protein
MLKFWSYSRYNKILKINFKLKPNLVNGRFRVKQCKTDYKRSGNKSAFLSDIE